MCKFSVLQPGTYALPHNGPTNGRLRCHLGVIVPGRYTLDQALCPLVARVCTYLVVCAEPYGSIKLPPIEGDLATHDTVGLR